MSALDEHGHIPEDVVYSHEWWTEAARVCGVDRVEVQARWDAVERLNDLRDAAVDALGEYSVAINCELELLPWGRRERVRVAAAAAPDRVAEFMAAADEARALIEGSN